MVAAKGSLLSIKEKCLATCTKAPSEKISGKSMQVT